MKYLHIGKEIEAFEKRLPAGEKIPVLLLTATASPWLQRETARNLHVDIRPQNFIVQTEGADRPELTVSLRAVTGDAAKIRWIAEQLNLGGRFYKKRGIIFSAFADGGEGLGARNAPAICQALQAAGVKRSGYYHGGMSLEERRDNQRRFREGQLRVLVATKAFGMGIDLPKLDFIIHFYPPLSLEEYWQEAGRGGRDMDTQRGEHCSCIVLHSPSDYRVLRGFPSRASFEKTLSTFTAAAQGELTLNIRQIRPGGKLRKFLTRLHQHKDLRQLKRLRVGNVTLERWKLRQPAHTVLKHIEKLFEEEGLKSKQTSRIRSNLRIRSASDRNVIRVPHVLEGPGPRLGYYDTELNWLTEPEIAALEMLDDKPAGSMQYSCFRLLKPKLTRDDIRILARKINASRSEGYAKLDFVFNRFLKAKRGKAKETILWYLRAARRPR